MIFWKKVDINGYLDYRKDILVYLNTHFKWRIINRTRQFWNPVPLIDVDTYFSQLTTSLIQYGSIKEVSVCFLVNDNSTLHIDHTCGLNAGVKARLNIPLLNCAGSMTAFYSYSDIIKYPYTTNAGGTKTWSSSARLHLTPVTTIELNQPTILRTSEPHTVLNKNNKYPRISLTISFEEDIVKCLENE